MKTNTNKSVGPDAIPNWVLQDLFGIISARVCAIFNSSIREGCVIDQGHYKRLMTNCSHCKRNENP